MNAYNEAKAICFKYINFKGDKRRMSYIVLQRAVIECYMGRMTNFGKQLNLPTYLDFFYPKN